MKIVNELGQFQVDQFTLNAIESDNPVYKARIAIALPAGSWLYAPSSGHGLDVYKNRKASPTNVLEFQKVAKAYLAPYGPEVTDRIVTRGTVALQIRITKETING